MNQPPDIITRHNDHLTLQLRFIPEMVEACQNAELPIDALGNFEFWRKCLSDDGQNEFLFEWDDLDVEVKSVGEKLALLLYTFPKPLFANELQYAIVAINRENHTLQYFGLQLSAEGVWYAVRQTSPASAPRESEEELQQLSHIITKFDALPDPAEFIETIKEYVNNH